MRTTRHLSLALALALCAGGLFASEAPRIDLDLGDSASDGWASRRSELTVVTEGDTGDRLAFLLDQTDLTDLFRRTDRGWVYRAAELPLPVGEHTLEVYRIADNGQWNMLAELPLQVRSDRGFTERGGSVNADLDAHGTWSDDDSEGSERQEELEADLQLSATARLGRVDGGLDAEIQMVGVSDQERALRAGLDEDPDEFDLASYVVRASFARGSAELGHATWGESRHLIDSFSSRGLVASTRLGSHVELSAAALNGSQIVGWENPFGLDSSEHRALAGRFGFELRPSDPGVFRFAATLLDASIRPEADFDQGAITDAEESEGWSVELQAASPGRRIRFAGGFTRSEFTNPVDPFLDQGSDVVQVEKEERDARYAELDLALVRLFSESGRNFDLSLSASHSRVDPLFRSAGAWVQSDLEQNRVTLDMLWGGATAQAFHSWSEDNLDDIPSILTTETRLSGGQIAIPFADFASEPSAALPLFSLGFQRTHQEAEDLPIGGGFSPGHLPDQVSETFTAGLDWGGASWQAGLQFEQTEQDNRQPGREEDDFDTQVANAFVFWTVGSSLDLGFELSHERFENKKFEETDVTRRAGVRATWRPTDRQSLTPALSWTETDLRPLRGSDDRLVLDLEWSWRFLERTRGQHGSTAQLYFRGSSDDNDVIDRVFGFEQHTRSWTVVSGVALSLH